MKSKQTIKTKDWGPILIKELLPNPLTVVLLITGGGMVLGAGTVRIGAGSSTSLTLGIILLGTLIILATSYLCSIFKVVSRYKIPMLNMAPIIKHSYALPTHETIKCGVINVRDENESTRPHTLIWIENSTKTTSGSVNNYQWYQYVRPVCSINDVKQLDGKIFKSPTGLTYMYGRWNPDCYNPEIKKPNLAFCPSGLDLQDENPVMPYKNYPIPQTMLKQAYTNLKMILTPMTQGKDQVMGIFDPPKILYPPITEPPNTTQIEKYFLTLISTDQHIKHSHQKPDSENIFVMVSVDVRSYLICTRDNDLHCIGYMPWNSTTNVKLSAHWNELDSNTSERLPTWKINLNAIDYSYKLTTENWMPHPDR